MVEAVVRRTRFNPASDTTDAGAEVYAITSIQELASEEDAGDKRWDLKVL